MIIEINSRHKQICNLCGYEWSAMLGDDEIPTQCDCDVGDGHLACDGWPNCDVFPDLCSYNGHQSQLVGHKD